MADTQDYAIMVVDDDEPIVKNLRRLLKREGFEKITTALTGEQGLKLLESAKEPFFLILSDQRMPGMPGSEFLEESIIVSPESRRMLITGYSDFDAIVDAVNLGAIHQYISKPWNNDDFISRVKTELEIYKQHQERKRMFKVTSHQNSKLFDFASKLRVNDQKHLKLVKEKEKEVEELEQAVTDAKAEAVYKEKFLGLDELLSRTITINSENLVESLSVVKEEVNLMMDRISRKNSIEFSPDNVADEVGDQDEHVYDIIDLIIENVVQTVEPNLSGIGSEPNVGVTVDDYKEVPDFGTLAFNDGFVTKGELENAREELEEKESQASTGLTIDKVLVSNNYLRRRDLSRIFAKSALIEMRLLDKELGRMMIEQELVSRKDVDRALRKQLNTFEDSGAAFLLGDILVDSEIITPEQRDGIMATQDRGGKGAKDDSAEFSSEFGAFVDLQISEDRTQAYIRVPKTSQGTEDIAPIKKLIKKRGIKYGIVSDKAIKDFIKNCTDPHEKFVVAQGIPVSIGKPAEIKYHFNTEQEAAGVIREDGSIDFTSRGDSPYVKRGTLLAEKIPMEQAKAGKDVFGETLLVSDVDDVELAAGEGVELSEDGLSITAAITGQPNLDLKGVVSVLEQFTVNGDVDFKTGNINFKGNVVVKGTVKEGFTVECEELIADEINGGIIRINGELKVSKGIVNADIQTQGGVQAKFVNNSKIYAYRNMMITREIMESRIAISGELNNDAGRITSSFVSARLGMNLKQVGTEKAEASTVKAGADDHIQWIASKYDSQMDDIRQELDEVIGQKKSLDDENNDLHVQIANQTFAQEKITKKIDFTEKKIGEVTGDARQQLAREIKELEKNMEQADERIKSLFEEQDELLKSIEECERQIEKFNAELEGLEKEKRASIKVVERDQPVPIIKVSKRIYAGNRITGTQASTIIKNDVGMCKFVEIDSGDANNPKVLDQQNL